MEVMAWRPSTVRVCSLEGREAAGAGVEHEERAEANAGVGDERRAGVEAEGAAGEEDAAGGEGGMLARVGDLVDVVGAEGRCGGQGAERQFESRAMP